jgi:hypothetical protein
MIYMLKCVKNFIILFDEKEGTSAIVRLLDNFDKISVLHHSSGSGWEPFDRHCCGRIDPDDLFHCLNIIFSSEVIDFQYLNKIYRRSANEGLSSFDSLNVSKGFKMRLKNPSAPGWMQAIPLLANYNYTKRMFQLFKRYNIVVFIAIRRDLLRWALSKYHGGGSGKPGHLQFALAEGRISREDIGKIYVEESKLQRLIHKCEGSHAYKYKLASSLRKVGLEVRFLEYEEFLDDKVLFFKKIQRILGVNHEEDEEILRIIDKGTLLKKVHSYDISEFVINSDDIMFKFGHYTIAI